MHVNSIPDSLPKISTTDAAAWMKERNRLEGWCRRWEDAGKPGFDYAELKEEKGETIKSTLKDMQAGVFRGLHVSSAWREVLQMFKEDELLGYESFDKLSCPEKDLEALEVIVYRAIRRLYGFTIENGWMRDYQAFGRKLSGDVLQGRNRQWRAALEHGCQNWDRDSPWKDFDPKDETHRGR